MTATSYAFMPDNSIEPVIWDSVLDLKVMENYNTVRKPRNTSSSSDIVQMIQREEYFPTFDSSSASSPHSDRAMSSSDSRRSSKIMTEMRSTVPDKVEVGFTDMLQHIADNFSATS